MPKFRSIAVLALMSCALLWPASTHADQTQCYEAVKQKRFERLTTVCIDLPHRNRLEKMRLLMSGEFTHYLGTVEKPSMAFDLLKQFAVSNDNNAQYMYSQLYGTAHTAAATAWDTHPANKGEQPLGEYNAAVKAEARLWLRRAAENGHTLALLEVAESMLLQSYTEEDVDLREALSIAERANEHNSTLSASLIQRLKKRIVEY